MANTYIIGQICGFVAWIFFLGSYHAKRENKIILYQLIASILYILNYYFIEAGAGFWISLFELIKTIGYYKTDKDKYIFFYSLPIYGVIIYFNGLDILTLIAVCGSFIDGYVMLKSKKTMVIGGILSCLLWIIYDACFLDFAGVISDSFIIISNASILINGFNKYLHRNNVHTVKPMYISKSTIGVIDKLDKQLLDKEYRWDKQTIEKLTRNKKYSYILLKDKKRVIGYVNFLNIKQEIYEKMIESTTIYDTFNEEDVIDYKANRASYLNLNAIVTRDEYENSNTIEKIETSINDYIKKMKKKRYYIKEICSFSVNHLEEKILEDLEFEKIKEINNECYLYKKTI